MIKADATPTGLLEPATLAPTVDSDVESAKNQTSGCAQSLRQFDHCRTGQRTAYIDALKRVDQDTRTALLTQHLRLNRAVPSRLPDSGTAVHKVGVNRQQWRWRWRGVQFAVNIT